MYPIKAQDPREKIIAILKTRGPSLPVPLAKEIGLSTLFTSAFLSELVSNKEVKISGMKVGSSPLYFISGQEPKLENFSQHLQSREKDAFLLLKEKKFLKDKKLEPAIRVALRELKDFAIPFQKNDEIYWRYFTTPIEDFPEEKPKKIEEVKEKAKEEKHEEPILEKPKQKKLPSRKEKKLDIFEEPEKEVVKKEESIRKVSLQNLEPKELKKEKKPAKKDITKKQNEKFFEKVKDFLSKKSIEIKSIENINRNGLVLRVKIEGEEKLMIAHNKKKISEEDLIKASKKASELNLQYIILCLGEPSKKIKDVVTATKNLSKMEKLE